MRIVFAFAIMISFVSLSCRKKIELDEPEKKYSDIEARFFNLLPNSDPMLQKVANDLKEREYIKPFIRNWVKNNGYPLWDKAIIQKGKGQANRSQSSPDSFVLIPFSLPGSGSVRSVLNTKINDTINYRFLEQHKYWQAGFQNDQLPNANLFMSLIMCIDNMSFGHENFWFRDSRLFKSNPSSADSGKYQFVQFKQHTQTDNRSIGIVYQLCYDVTAPCNGQLTGCNPGDPCNPYCTNTYCQDLFVWFENDQNQYLNPFGAQYWANNTSPGGGGGYSGGSGNTGDAQLDEGGVPTSFILFPLIEPSTIRDSLTNPCLSEAKSRITNERLTNFITRAYYNTFTMYADIRFIEDPTIVDTSGLPIPAKSYPISPNPNTLIWRILLNPSFFKPVSSPGTGWLSTKEYTATIILHEIVHGLIYYREKAGFEIKADTPHIKMFRQWTQLMVTTLREAFPALSQQDALALAISGINDVLKVKYNDLNEIASYDQQFGMEAIQMGISVPVADSIAQEFKIGLRGNICP